MGDLDAGADRFAGPWDVEGRDDVGLRGPIR